jgi:hypothetical protein
MANRKISELDELVTASQDDALPIVDTVSSETKKIKISGVKSSLNLQKSDVGLSNVDNTSDLNKPISTATQTALNGKQNTLSFTPEDSANKSTDTALGSSDTLYPTQNAVKTYVDNGLATKQDALTFTPEDVANKDNGALSTSTTSYPTSGAVKTYVDNGLATKQDSLGFTPEDVANKDNGALSTSTTSYPTSGAVKTYVDNGLATKQDSLGFTPEDVSNKDNGALSTSSTSYPTSGAVKTYVDNGLSGKSDTGHTHTTATTSSSGFMSSSDKNKLDQLRARIIGPGTLLQFSGTLFQNSGYVPGIGVNSTPSAFGFFSVQNTNFLFNPVELFGPNRQYRIRAIRRQDGAFNDGTHCMIRVVSGSSPEAGVPGLLDFGSGINSYAQAVSDIITAPSSSTNMWFRVYFASYNGGNGATVQDVTLYIEEVI